MLRQFSGDTANDIWHAVASSFRDGNCAISQPSRAGNTEEILHAAISIESPRQRWITTRTPPINPAFAIAEVIWILTGRNDSKFLNYFNGQLPLYAGSGLTYDGAYGHRLRVQFGMDQLQRAYEALSVNPSSRQVVLQIWDARTDLPSESGAPKSPDVPCNVLAMLKVRENKLHWTQIMRSNDAFRGLPYNIIQFTTLQEVLAGWLGVEMGSYTHFSDSLHLYQDCLQHIAVLPDAKASTPRNSDSLCLPKGESELAFMQLGRDVERIIEKGTSSSSLIQLATATDLPMAYRNLRVILCAEGLRRRRDAGSAETILNECANPALVHLFRQWLKNLARKRLAPAATS